MRDLLGNPENLQNDGPEINCEIAREQLALLLYGELSFDEEEKIETHLDKCAECRAALERQKALHAALDVSEVTPSPALLASCRAELAEALDSQPAIGVAPIFHPVIRDEAERRSWWEDFKSSFRISFLKPAGAFGLVAVGFLAARLMPGPNIVGDFGAAGDDTNGMSLAGAQVRSVLPQTDGRVQIVFDETHQKTLSGTMDDQSVRALLLSAAKAGGDPNLRAETVGLLLGGAEAADVREVLVFALENDQNSIVRWKALEGLKGYTHEPSVQSALAQVLLRDSNPGLRTQAIDLLMARDGKYLDRQVIGAMQELMSHENDSFVRQRCQRALQAVKASSEIY